MVFKRGHSPAFENLGVSFSVLVPGPNKISAAAALVRHPAAGAVSGMGQRRLGSSFDSGPRHEVVHAAISEGIARRTRRKQDEVANKGISLAEMIESVNETSPTGEGGINYDFGRYGLSPHDARAIA